MISCNRQFSVYAKRVSARLGCRRPSFWKCEMAVQKPSSGRKVARSAGRSARHKQFMFSTEGNGCGYTVATKSPSAEYQIESAAHSLSHFVTAPSRREPMTYAKHARRQPRRAEYVKTVAEFYIDVLYPGYENRCGKSGKRMP